MQASTTPNTHIRIRLKQEVEKLAILPAELDLLQALFLEYCHDLTADVHHQDNPTFEEIQGIPESSSVIKRAASK